MTAAVDQIIPYTHIDQLREAKRIIEHEATALRNIAIDLDARFCAAVDRIEHCQGSVVVTGIGKAGIIGQKIASTMSSTGTRAHFVHPAEAVHGDLGSLHEDDIVLILSNSGETEEVCRLLPLLEQRGIAVIAITATCHSTLGHAAEITIPLGRLREAGLHGLPPSTSTTAMLAVGDALALVLARVRGFGSQDFAQYHPAGSLGRKLTSVTKIMRTDDSLRIAKETQSVREVFGQSWNQARRTGAVMIVDDEEKLIGIFTDSDLARLLANHQEQKLDRPIREVMTSRPTTISRTAVLGEAVDMMAERKLSELPVVDDDGFPVGMLDITDLIALMPQSLELNS
ncbi:KpsF/GutQ family sugar-phosphate isomerase [uncultured Rubinisphaera sp.]|uniref:KpsF/GutQ family sugar-phosphate isomerase n=1 Tax=uncultured Rubinisphaera sp. TaxID=1678686 RepID=UPI0030DB87AE